MKTLFIIPLMFVNVLVFSQEHKKPLSYYLPSMEYEAGIPTPEQYLGYQVGEWHPSHDQIVGYFKLLDGLSDKIEIVEYARSHENRPLIAAIISSPENLKNKDEIKRKHKLLSHYETASSVDISNLPAVLWQGYSIHGNEASGYNASLLVVYYLIAGKGKQVIETLNNMVILMDPCLNPDGVQRFSTWVNSHKSQTLVTDPGSREFNEAWPGGRYNHYWFDMNRDWLLLVHPESRGRVRMLHEWNPNVLTDHHEMGSNSTFFFHPGIPTGNNPNTPEENFVLTEKIGKFHASFLDSIGSLYYTKSNFDDFYYGKGSTYPDAMGCMGILFEQASSRGHVQATDNGNLTFPFTIRNQVTTSLSTHAAVNTLKSDILNFKKRFFPELVSAVNKQVLKGFVFSDQDEARLAGFINVLLQHHIDVYELDQATTVNGINFSKEKSYVVPLAQSQPILAKTIFEEVRTFRDSSFYDVSGWTMSHAFGLKVAEILSTSVKKGQKITEVPGLNGNIQKIGKGGYAFIIEPGQVHFHKALYYLQQKGIKTRISNSELELQNGKDIIKLPKGAAIIPSLQENIDEKSIQAAIMHVNQTMGIKITDTESGNGTSLVSFGHPSINPITAPKPAVIVGAGIQPQSAGEVWHHLDINLNMPVTLLENSRMRSLSLDKYNILIFPEGNYSQFSDSDVSKIQDWCQKGNTIIAIGNATSWLSDKKLIGLTQKKSENKGYQSGIYENADREADARVLAGSVLRVNIDTTHPLFYGFRASEMATMKTSQQFYNPTTNVYATPAKYSRKFQISGYIPKTAEQIIPDAAVVTVHGLGSGKVICMQDSPLFRGYWYSGHTLFNNALFNASLIDRRTIETGR